MIVEQHNTHMCSIQNVSSWLLLEAPQPNPLWERASQSDVKSLNLCGRSFNQNVWIIQLLKWKQTPPSERQTDLLPFSLEIRLQTNDTRQNESLFYNAADWNGAGSTGSPLFFPQENLCPVTQNTIAKVEFIGNQSKQLYFANQHVKMFTSAILKLAGSLETCVSDPSPITLADPSYMDYFLGQSSSLKDVKEPVSVCVAAATLTAELCVRAAEQSCSLTAANRGYHQSVCRHRGPSVSAMEPEQNARPLQTTSSLLC